VATGWSHQRGERQPRRREGQGQAQDDLTGADRRYDYRHIGVRDGRNADRPRRSGAGLCAPQPYLRSPRGRARGITFGQIGRLPATPERTAGWRVAHDSPQAPNRSALPTSSGTGRFWTPPATGAPTPAATSTTPTTPPAATTTTSTSRCSTELRPPASGRCSHRTERPLRPHVTRSGAGGHATCAQLGDTSEPTNHTITRRAVRMLDRLGRDSATREYFLSDVVSKSLC
jgi:hypothetical protein